MGIAKERATACEAYRPLTPRKELKTRVSVTESKISVILAHRNTGAGKVIEVPTYWEYGTLYRHVRQNHPEYCFVESIPNKL